SVQLAAAQMHGGFARGFGRGIGSHRATRRFAQGGFPAWPYFYSDYDFSEPYLTPNDAEDSVESIRPQILLVQPASTGDSSQSVKPRPLLIERQGDRYVRFGGIQKTKGHGTLTLSEYSASAITRALPAIQRQRTEVQAPEPPAVLVYRDGRREDITDYAIVNGVIYVSGNYVGGSYYATRHILLAALDLPATVQANRDRGLKFMLPSAANVVIASF
ncbi:MAG: hypothetical protein WB566_11715, partial [Terriglobales bacterium]